jgi:hypothetical protein
MLAAMFIPHIYTICTLPKPQSRWFHEHPCAEEDAFPAFLSNAGVWARYDRSREIIYSISRYSDLFDSGKRADATNHRDWQEDEMLSEPEQISIELG